MGSNEDNGDTQDLAAQQLRAQRMAAAEQETQDLIDERARRRPDRCYHPVTKWLAVAAVLDGTAVLLHAVRWPHASLAALGTHQVIWAVIAISAIACGAIDRGTWTLRADRMRDAAEQDQINAHHHEQQMYALSRWKKAAANAELEAYGSGVADAVNAAPGYGDVLPMRRRPTNGGGYLTTWRTTTPIE